MRSLIIGCFFFSVILLMAIMSQLQIGQDPVDMNISEKFATPSLLHWLGTDQFGRDILSRVMHAAGIALIVSIGAVTIGMLLGCLLGAIAGVSKGVLESMIMRTMDGIFAFPNLLLALLIVVVLGVGGNNVLIAIAIFNIPLFARLMYGFILEAKEYGYVKAAITYGASKKRLLFKHMIPTAMPKIGIQLTTSMGAAILIESSLSFLGLGVQPPFPSWGTMLSESQNFLAIAPWYPIIPGIAILLAVMGFNLIGDGIRQWKGEEG